LKPIDPGELEKTLEKAVGQLNHRAAEQARLGEMEVLVDEALPLLRERYLVRLMSAAPGEDEAAIAAHLKKLGIRADGPYFFAAVLSPYYRGEAMDDWAVQQIALENLLKQMSSAYRLTCVTQFDAQFRGIVLAQGARRENDDLEALLARARDKLQLNFQIDFCAGVGEGVERLSALHESYRSAVTALDYRAAYGRNNIVNIRDVLVMEPLRAENSSRELEGIVEAFRNANQTELLALVREYLNRALLSARGSALSVKRECVKLLSELLNNCGEVRHETEKLFSQEPYEAILRCEDPLSTQRKFLSLVEELLNSLGRMRAQRSRRVIEQAKAFIFERSADPELNLDAVSRAVGLSAAYFSSLFREETGQTFIGYLNAVRVEKAKQLLLAANSKIYEVALEVGYTNPSYFFEVFKKSTGMRPREFIDRALS
jgi:YesN/AraC family two-component response regulator